MACAGGRQEPPSWVPAARPQPEVTPSQGAFQPMSRGGGSSTASGQSLDPRTFWRPLPPQGLFLGRAPRVVSCHSVTSATFLHPQSPHPHQAVRRLPMDPHGRPRMGHPSGPEGRRPCWEVARRIPHVLQDLAAPARLTRSSSPCPRAPWSLARRTGLQRGRGLGMGAGMKPHIASGPRRRWGLLLGTRGSSLRARGT